MSIKADGRLAKLASFGASAASKQIERAAPSIDTTPSIASARGGSAVPDQGATGKQAATMIRNVAFSAQEQEILKMLMECLRGAGEMSPNLSLAVKVGLRLIPESPPMDSVKRAIAACKALDGRRKASRQKHAS